MKLKAIEFPLAEYFASARSEKFEVVFSTTCKTSSKIIAYSTFTSPLFGF